MRHDEAMGRGMTVLAGEVRERLVGAELTYRKVGATAGGLPAGCRQLKRSVTIGHGGQVFAAASDAVLHWQVQRRAGLRVAASSPTVVAGAVVILGLGLGPLRLQAPCRVVYVVDEPRRSGFAYGTLAGHPESGEEAFVVEHHGSDAVSLTITAFSRPASRLAKAVGPLNAIAQGRITNRYLRSLVASP
jgi:uncharacterized protein (UPF0548 family)